VRWRSEKWGAAAAGVAGEVTGDGGEERLSERERKKRRWCCLLSVSLFSPSLTRCLASGPRGERGGYHIIAARGVCIPPARGAPEKSERSRHAEAVDKPAGVTDTWAPNLVDPHVRARCRVFGDRVGGGGCARSLRLRRRRYARAPARRGRGEVRWAQERRGHVATRRWSRWVLRVRAQGGGRLARTGAVEGEAAAGPTPPTLSSHVRRESGDQEYVNDEVKRDGRPRLKSGRLVPVLVVSFP
jgi:hypothetical protein